MIMQVMSIVSIVTGATRNLAFFLVQGLAQRLERGDTVYLTGRDGDRVADSVRRISGARAEVRGEVLDVSDRAAINRLAELIAARHGGVDLVLSNHYARTQPEDDPAKVVDRYVAANNLGTTDLLRSFAPLLRDHGRLLVIASRAGSLRAIAPVLHDRFGRPSCSTTSIVSYAVGVMLFAKAAQPARRGPLGSIFPRKWAKVAAVRALAGQRRADDLRRGILIAAISPGLIDTGASRQWLDMRGARTPEEIAGPVLDLALEPSVDPAFYGELVHLGTDVTLLGGAAGSCTVLPWKA